MFSRKIIALGSLSLPHLDSSFLLVVATAAALYIVKPTYLNSIIPTSLLYPAFSWRPKGAAGGPNRKLEGWLHPPIVSRRSWLSSIKVFNLLFIMPVEDAYHLCSPFISPLVLRSFTLMLSYVRVCVSVCWIRSSCIHARIHVHTAEYTSSRLWGLRSVSLCACTCSRVCGAALTARREAEGDGNSDGGSSGGCHGSKSTSV